MPTRLETRVVRKTTAYTISPPLDRSGTIFTNAGASGSVFFTLPKATKAVFGWSYRFSNVVGQELRVVGPANGVITLNEPAAISVRTSTVGGEMEAHCVETSAGVYQWVVSGIAVGHAYTVAA